MIETLENRRMFSLTDVAVWSVANGWMTNEAGLTFSTFDVENEEDLQPNTQVELTLTSMHEIGRFRDLLITVYVDTLDRAQSDEENFLLSGGLNDWGEGVMANDVSFLGTMSGWKDFNGDPNAARGPYTVIHVGDDDWHIKQVVVQAHIPDVWIPTASKTIVEGNEVGNVAQVQRDDLFWTERSLTVRVEVEEYHNDPNHRSIDDIGEVLLDGESDGYLNVVIAKGEHGEGFDMAGAIDTDFEDTEAFRLKIVEPFDPLYDIDLLHNGSVIYYIDTNQT